MIKYTGKDKIYYGLDHQGTTVLVTDETGEAVWSAESTPFGDHVMGGIKIREVLKLKYTGKDYDEDTDLYYFNARWYDAGTGRFITEDPARDGANWYIYTANNPLKFIDPTGMYQIQSPYSLSNDPNRDQGYLINKSNYSIRHDFERLIKSKTPTFLSKDKQSRADAGGPTGDYGESRIRGDFGHSTWLGVSDERAAKFDKAALDVYSSVYGASQNSDGSIRAGANVDYASVSKRMDAIFSIVVPSLKSGSVVDISGILGTDSFKQLSKEEQALIASAVGDIIERDDFWDKGINTNQFSKDNGNLNTPDEKRDTSDSDHGDDENRGTQETSETDDSGEVSNPDDEIIY